MTPGSRDAFFGPGIVSDETKDWMDGIAATFDADEARGNALAEQAMAGDRAEALVAGTATGGTGRPWFSDYGDEILASAAQPSEKDIESGQLYRAALIDAGGGVLQLPDRTESGARASTTAPTPPPSRDGAGTTDFYREFASWASPADAPAQSSAIPGQPIVPGIIPPSATTPPAPPAAAPPGQPFVPWETQIEHQFDDLPLPPRHAPTPVTPPFLPRRSILDGWRPRRRVTRPVEPPPRPFDPRDAWLSSPWTVGPPGPGAGATLGPSGPPEAYDHPEWTQREWEQHGLDDRLFNMALQLEAGRAIGTLAPHRGFAEPLWGEFQPGISASPNNPPAPVPYDWGRGPRVPREIGLPESFVGPEIDTFSGAPFDSRSVAEAGEPLAAAGTSVSDLLADATASDANGLTNAGRSLSKHNSVSRPGTDAILAPTGGPAAINAQAQQLVESILNDPGANVVQRMQRSGQAVLQVNRPDGVGVIYKWNGQSWVFSHFGVNLY